MEIKLKSQQVDITIKEWSQYTIDLFKKYTTANNVNFVINADKNVDVVAPKKTRKKHTSYKHWTQEEDAYLLENHGKLKNQIISEHLNRSVQGMYIRLNKLKKKTKIIEQIEVPPQGTETFFTWMDEKKNGFQFRPEDIIDHFSELDEEMLEKIIIFGIKQGVLLQMNKNLFQKNVS